MADQKRWFKVWTSVVSDDDFDPSRPTGLLSLGRFSMLGAFTALHGNRGRVGITLPTLLRITSATNLDELRADLAFKNVTFEEGKNPHGKVTVTWQKWKKYQEDSTQAERQKASRAKRRGEEKRGEEKRETTTVSSADDVTAAKTNGFSAWPQEWDPLKAKIEALPFLKQHAAWLDDLQWWITLDEWLTSAPKPLDELLTDAVAHIVSTGYMPRTKNALRAKIKNCLHVAGRIAEREAQTARPATR